MSRCAVLTLAALGAVAALLGDPGHTRSSEALGRSITLVITEVRSSDGVVRVGVFDAEDAFPRGDAVARTRVAAQSGTVIVTVADLPAGAYAFAFYHDENGNGAFDRTLLGLPDEGFGFSRDAPVGFGPPSFAEAAVDFDGISLTLTAHMRYF